MAAADTKELAQCLAFAYFAENKNYKGDDAEDKKKVKEAENNHAVGFLSLFAHSESVSHYKSKYLSNNFPIDLVKKEFAVTVTPKSGAIKYHMTARKVYKVAKYCIENGLIPGGISRLHEYEFLDQHDPLVLLIKDETLKKVLKAFNLKFKIDSLSPVDIFFVKKTARTKIEKAFRDNFSSTQVILENAIWGSKGVNDYSGTMLTFMNAGELIPISLKLPNAINSDMHIKKIQYNGTDVATEIDPYIKFLSAIVADPSKAKEMINKVIEIDFKKFSLGNTLNWVFPVNFNYSHIKLGGEPLAKYNLRFNLFAQGHGAGWNGQFDNSTRMHQGTQWVGGVGAPTFEYFANKYPEYKKVIKEVTDIRVSILEELAAEMKSNNSVVFENYKHDYQYALQEAKQEKILSIKSSGKLLAFFRAYESDTKLSSKLFHIFLTRILDRTRGFKQKYRQAVNKKGELAKLTVDAKTEAHYVHAQISWFLLSGGPSMELYFKQRMFLTIFGLITKKAHIRIDDYNNMKNTIQQEISTKTGLVMAEFSATPHYIVS